MLILISRWCTATPPPHDVPVRQRRCTAEHLVPLLQVTGTDPEPAHSVLEENYRELALQISASVNFASYQCQTRDVRFKETLVYQTREFE